MPRLAPGTPAPDLEATGVDGRPVRLADFRGRQAVVLVFLRGFT